MKCVYQAFAYLYVLHMKYPNFADSQPPATAFSTLILGTKFPQSLFSNLQEPILGASVRLFSTEPSPLIHIIMCCTHYFV
jgi:hypothetical protein